MNNIINTDEKVIVCMNFIQLSFKYLIFNAFYIDETNKINIISFTPFQFYNNITFIKSTASTDRSKTLICVFQESGESNFLYIKIIKTSYMI